MNVKCLLTVAVHGRVEIVLNISILGGYTVCRISLVWFMNGNRNGILLNGIPFPFISIKKILKVPFPFISVKTNFESSIKFPFPLAAACFRMP